MKNRDMLFASFLTNPHHFIGSYSSTGHDPEIQDWDIRYRGRVQTLPKSIEGNDFLKRIQGEAQAQVAPAL
jgi:hypothetical protein